MDQSLECKQDLLPLKYFDELSADAQKVMLSLQKKYSKMREQMIAAQLKKELISQDPGDYYKSLYYKQFKAQPPNSRPPSSEPHPSWSTETTESRYFPDQLQPNVYDAQGNNVPMQIKVEPPYSPYFAMDQFKKPVDLQVRKNCLLIENRVKAESHENMEQLDRVNYGSAMSRRTCRDITKARLPVLAHTDNVSLSGPSMSIETHMAPRELPLEVTDTESRHSQLVSRTTQMSPRHTPRLEQRDNGRDVETRSDKPNSPQPFPNCEFNALKLLSTNDRKLEERCKLSKPSEIAIPQLLEDSCSNEIVESDLEDQHDSSTPNMVAMVLPASFNLGFQLDSQAAPDGPQLLPLEADILTAKTVEADILTAKTVEADILTAKTVEADILTAKTVEETILTAKTVEADILTAKTVEADILTAKTVEADILTAKTVEADILTAKTVEADILTAKTVEADILTAKTVEADILTAKAVEAGILTAKTVEADILTAKTVENLASQDLFAASQDTGQVLLQYTDDVLPRDRQQLPHKATEQVLVSGNKEMMATTGHQEEKGETKASLTNQHCTAAMEHHHVWSRAASDGKAHAVHRPDDDVMGNPTFPECHVEKAYDCSKSGQITDPCKSHHHDASNTGIETCQKINHKPPAHNFNIRHQFWNDEEGEHTAHPIKGQINMEGLMSNASDKRRTTSDNMALDMITPQNQKSSDITPRYPNIMENYFKKSDCSVARKLEMNKAIRKREDVTRTKRPSEHHQSTNESRKVPKFSIPTKKASTKGHGPVQKKYVDHVDQSAACSGLVNVLDMEVSERHDLKEDLLRSLCVCLSLVYSDNSTLFTAFQTIGLKGKYIAMSPCKGNNSRQSVFLFPYTVDDDVAVAAGDDDDYNVWFRTLIADLMNKCDVEKIVLNAKQLCVEVFKILGKEKSIGHSSWIFLDPAIASWLLNSDKPPKCLQDVIRESGMRTTISIVQHGVQRLSVDMSLLYDIMTVMKVRLQSHDLWELFLNVETCLIPILASLELQQFRVNTEILVSFSDILKKKLSKLEKKAFESIGHTFCINSHPQLRQVLFEELRLDTKLPTNQKIAKTCVANQKSTSEATLTRLLDTHALPAIVLEYRQLQKLKSTYIDGMLSCVKQGHLSTHWDQTAACTGRLTSYQPNVQAIPRIPVSIAHFQDNYIVGKSDEKTVDIYAREPFISHDACVLLAADFQQIELRLLAHLASDLQLLRIFNDPNVADIFIELTAQWLGKKNSEVSTSEREQTKRIVYSVMYGVGKDKLAEYLKVSPDHAKSIMNSFLIKFPAVNMFTKNCIDICQQQGYTQTIFKRRRLIPNINHPSHNLRAQAGRQAVNFCLQGSAADLCKAAMLKVQSRLNKHNLASKARLLAQIHDELLWEVTESHIDQVKDVVRCVMEDSEELCGHMTRLNVPVRVSLSVGTSWAHLQQCSCV